MLHRSVMLVLVAVFVFAGTIFADDKPAKPQSPADAMKLPTDPKEALAAARWLAKSYGRSRPPEAVRMLIAIADGTWIQPEGGWFGPCDTRYTWEWLARHHGVTNGGITRKQFRGSSLLFQCLDRDQDGSISPDDLDWSSRSKFIQRSMALRDLFMRMNTRRDGKISKEDLLAFFKQASRGKDHLTFTDLQEALVSAPPPPLGPGDAPNQEMLVRSLFAGELGSLNEGPGLNQSAPDFTLKSPDGKTTIQLSKLIGPRPVVLVLGNYTCAPFCRTAGELEQMYQRYQERATFIGVYVREAHPTDGWAMESNNRRGVAIPQPKSYEQRAAVCTQFCERIRPTFPFVVDEINDPVGNAYSGMPGRIYVIDPRGKVAYKSGRGPFGFKVGEFEQALAMSLLEFPTPPKKLVETSVRKPAKPR